MSDHNKRPEEDDSKPQVSLPPEKPFLNEETALRDIERWLDYKKIGSNKRESNKDFIEQLTTYVVEGDLIVEDDYKITHKLKFPIEGERGSIETLTYKPLLNMKSLTSRLKNVKPTDGDARMTAYICVATDTGLGIIQALNTEDNSIATAIVVFFG